jgi:dephospho-CoA kinase
MIILGLTGSIGMGKSTTAKLFEAEGVPVADSDAIVHRLYAGRAVPLIEKAFPGVVVDGVVNRQKLSQHVIGRPDALKKLENIIHPLVRKEQDLFLQQAKDSGAKFAVLDIPLLFETAVSHHTGHRFDKIITVTAPPHVQRDRVLARPGMSVEKFEAIIARQMPDAEKRRRSDFVIDTYKGLEAARDDVRAILVQLSKTA